ncbi:MAG: glycosyltransferase family 2 protein [Bacteroidetes bacterium]|nr:glycosyltransferase family 2 protein [Bacteroidota bacterium]
MRLSVVVPVYNEEELIDSLCESIRSSLSAITDDYEVVIVDDGSQDSTLELLMKWHRQDNHFKILSLSRNFGHQAAYTAGLNHTKGDYVVMMDGDLQDPPELIAEMYVKLNSKNLDIVFGKRISRNEGFFKKIMIKLFHSIFSRMSNINAPVNVGNFCIMNRRALDSFIDLKEKNRYLPGLRYFIGFKQSYIEYERSARAAGKTKMGFGRLTTLAMNALFSFSNIPIRVCVYLGMIGVTFSLIAGGVVLYKKLTGDAISGWTSTLFSIYFFGSVQLLFLGIIGEYIYRIFVESQNRPIYIVREFHDD